MSQKFVQTITRLLKNVVTLSMKKGYILENPFVNMDKLPCDKKTNLKRCYISKKNVWRLVQIPDSSPVFKPMVVLLLRSGLRIGEVLALRWSDLDPENGLIHVEQGLSMEYDEDENGNLINKRYEIGDTKTPCSVRNISVDKKVFKALEMEKEFE